jgi:hypothetical protein
MGHSFIKFGKSTLRLRDGTFGILCGIILVEFEKLPDAKPCKKVMEPVCREIKDKSLFGGYDVVLDLNDRFPTPILREQASEFFNEVASTILKFGLELPEAYVSALPMGDWYKKMRWTVAEIVEPLKNLQTAVAANN